MGRIGKTVISMKEELRRDKRMFATYVAFRIVVVLCAIGALAMENYEAFFLCLLTLVLFFLPVFVEVNFKITIPETLETIIVVFIFAAEILGEMFNFYTIFPFWDTLLHTFNGFLAAAIGLALVSILNRSNKIAFTLAPAFCVIVAFCFSMTVGVLWEFFEFAMDLAFGVDMQKDTVISSIATVMLDPTGTQTPVVIGGIESVVVNGQELGLGGYLDIGLYDTMEDLFVNLVGAVVFSIIGYFYLKSKGEGVLVQRLVPTLNAEESKENLE